MNKSDLIITHGGVGSILTGLRYKKKVVIIAEDFLNTMNIMMIIS